MMVKGKDIRAEQPKNTFQTKKIPYRNLIIKINIHNNNKLI